MTMTMTTTMTMTMMMTMMMTTTTMTMTMTMTTTMVLVMAVAPHGAAWSIWHGSRRPWLALIKPPHTLCPTYAWPVDAFRWLEQFRHVPRRSSPLATIS